MKSSGINVEISYLFTWVSKQGSRMGNDIKIGNELFFIELDPLYVSLFRYGHNQKTIWGLEKWEKEEKFFEIVETYEKYLEFLRVSVVKYL